MLAAVETIVSNGVKPKNISNGIGEGHSNPSDLENTLEVIDKRTGRSYNLPIEHNAIAASELKQITTEENSEYYADQNELGIRVFDPGFSNTAVSKSSITYIDGQRGEILYRGYSIKDIVGRKSFLDTAYLLIWGEWPSADQSGRFESQLNNVPVPDRCVFNAIRSIPPEGSCMGMIIVGLMALQSTQMSLVPAHAAKDLYQGNSELVDQEIIKFMGNFTRIAAIAYCHHTGRDFTEPKPHLSYVENFFVMTGHVDPASGSPNPEYVKYFDRLWICVANHEMTCSTAALLQTASSLPDVYSCMVSALSAMYGPLHGGAIEVAYKNIQEVGSVDMIPAKIQRVKERKERLYGYGHRLYKVKDPRSTFIREVVEKLQDEIEDNASLKIAFAIDRVASEDAFFRTRKLYLNADLYAAFAYNAMGYPPEFILPISMIARTAGFMAHWKEAMAGTVRIWRPGQIYTGHLDRKMDD